MSFLLIANWKMSLSASQSRELADYLATEVDTLSGVELWVAPSFVSILPVVEILKSKPVQIGAQNVSSAVSGAYTGEVSVTQLRELSCSFALVGHSERRQHFAEHDEIIAQRALGALSQDFTVALCIGETLAERNDGKLKQVIEQQLNRVAAAITSDQCDRLLICYEPVWAIGTGVVASLDDILHAQQVVSEVWSNFSSQPLPRFIYGGSVDNKNITQIRMLTGIAGVLVGSASQSIGKIEPLLKPFKQ